MYAILLCILTTSFTLQLSVYCICASVFLHTFNESVHVSRVYTGCRNAKLVRDSRPTPRCKCLRFSRVLLGFDWYYL